MPTEWKWRALYIENFLIVEAVLLMLILFLGLLHHVVVGMFPAFQKVHAAFWSWRQHVPPKRQNVSHFHTV
jgi:hypothetical protein